MELEGDGLLQSTFVSFIVIQVFVKGSLCTELCKDLGIHGGQGSALMELIFYGREKNNRCKKPCKVKRYETAWVFKDLKEGHCSWSLEGGVWESDVGDQKGWWQETLAGSYKSGQGVCISSNVMRRHQSLQAGDGERGWHDPVYILRFQFLLNTENRLKRGNMAAGIQVVTVWTTVMVVERKRRWHI